MTHSSSRFLAQHQQNISDQNLASSASAPQNSPDLSLRQQAVPPNPAQPHTGSCYGIQAQPGFSEHFIDFRFRDGSRVAFSYAELVLLSFDPNESKLDMNFREYWVALYGTSLDGDLYESLRDCRVRWVSEAASSRAADGHIPYIERIEIISPENANEESISEAGSEEHENG